MTVLHLRSEDDRSAFPSDNEGHILQPRSDMVLVKRNAGTRRERRRRYPGESISAEKEGSRLSAEKNE